MSRIMIVFILPPPFLLFFLLPQCRANPGPQGLRYARQVLSQLAASPDFFLKTKLGPVELLIHKAAIFGGETWGNFQQGVLMIECVSSVLFKCPFMKSE